MWPEAEFRGSWHLHKTLPTPAISFLFDPSLFFPLGSLCLPFSPLLSLHMSPCSLLPHSLSPRRRLWPSLAGLPMLVETARAGARWLRLTYSGLPGPGRERGASLAAPPQLGLPRPGCCPSFFPLGTGRGHTAAVWALGWQGLEKGHRGECDCGRCVWGKCPCECCRL